MHFDSTIQFPLNQSNNHFNVDNALNHLILFLLTIPSQSERTWQIERWIEKVNQEHKSRILDIEATLNTLLKRIENHAARLISIDLLNAIIYLKSKNHSAQLL